MQQAIKTMMQGIEFGGSVTMDSSSGKVHLRSEEASNQFLIDIENEETLQFLLHTLRQAGFSRWKLFGILRKYRQPFRVRVGDQPVIAREPNGKLNINYRNALQILLR